MVAVPPCCPVLLPPKTAGREGEAVGREGRRQTQARRMWTGGMERGQTQSGEGGGAGPELEWLGCGVEWGKTLSGREGGELIGARSGAAESHS